MVQSKQSQVKSFYFKLNNKEFMIEKQLINNKQVWIKVNPVHVDRDNSNIIPTEYFTASYYLQSPENNESEEIIKDENSEPKLFESPVAAISFASKKLAAIL